MNQPAESKPKDLNQSNQENSGGESEWDRTWRLAHPYVFRNQNQDQPKDWNKPKERK